MDRLKGYYTYNLASIISCSLNFDFNLILLGPFLNLYPQHGHDKPFHFIAQLSDQVMLLTASMHASMTLIIDLLNIH